ncbi:MAG: type II toxin-antitoxin system RelE/ParE family toxin [Elusimicrobiota bacterium]
MYEIRFSNEASKFYKKANSAIARQINMVIEHIKNNPFWGIHIKKMKGELHGSYRYRMGKIRVIYSIENNIIWIEAIGYRGGIY